MEKDRLLAFSDGVIAVIITIMVLELKVPHDDSLSSLAQATPIFLSYVLSFVYVAIYWNNHHHFFHLVRRVNGAILWANLHLLFWLSLIPFATDWVGEHSASAVPTAVYGVALLMPALSWYLLQSVIVRTQGRDSPLARVTRHGPEGQDIARALHRRHCVGIRRYANRRRSLRAGRVDVAGSRPARRKGGAVIGEGLAAARDVRPPPRHPRRGDFQCGLRSADEARVTGWLSRRRPGSGMSIATLCR